MWKAVADPFMNINKIFPLKQKSISDMIKVCKKDSNIKKVYIFGSSVTSACNPWSDIDIYFVLDHETNHLPVCHIDSEIWDRWSNFSVDNSLLDEIMRKGVLVYERSDK